ncbi:hypothetical protein JW848_10755 [Candidatus Bipolaricaulota bacterium]|nr:hypothetical protein [Candidatus Bipolaricaulota bacterium]
MIVACEAVGIMAGAVCEFLRRRPQEISTQVIPDLLVLERSIKAKLRMAEHHAALLDRATFEKLGRVVDPLSIVPEEPVIILQDEDWVISIRSALAGTLIRYMSFSVAVSSCVNAVDTLGRFLNRAYALELEARQASLKAVRGRLLIPSGLHSVLSDSPGLSWMVKLRDLRGECQHGGLAGLCYDDQPGKRSEPLVPKEYCLDGNAATISEYLDWAMKSTASLIANTARVIAANPENAVQFKS